jgi:ABC-type nickel/cobalt efflux system permease component RcnA
MDNSLVILSGTAASIALIHTALGPDHYLPFIMMGRARQWSGVKTVWVTLLCGFGHVLGSVVLGLMGILVGIQVMKLEVLEAFRGALAAWLLIGFGLAYFLYGIRKAILNRPHRHIHAHGALGEHEHEHTHVSDHVHVHDEGSKNVTPWILFTIFILGPCEPLIPLLMYPAAESGIWGTIFVASIFSVVTIATMLIIVMSFWWGVGIIKLGRMDRYAHAIAGGTICLSGMAIQFLGL